VSGHKALRGIKTRHNSLARRPDAKSHTH